MAIFETHCHLNHAQFESDCDSVIDRADQANVRRLLVVSYDLASSRRAVNLANKYAQINTAVGIHPEDASEWSDLTQGELVALCESNPGSIVAWGEIGLDYHWKTHEPDFQKRVFVEQLKTARTLGLPVIIHCREAYDDTLNILEDFGADRVVVHCFAGTVEQALRAVSLGYYIGIGGVLTYRNAADVRDIAVQIPVDRILIETDSPFLAPQKWRGKRNEPAYLTAVVSKLAELLEKSADEIEEITWNNAVSLFG
jgi:TatD DNase family protein